MKSSSGQWRVAFGRLALAYGILGFLPDVHAEDSADSSISEQSQPLVTRTDRFGDPLPPGAKLRLGTVRLRQGQGLNGVAFSPDGKHLVSTGWDDSIRFWDVADARLVRRLKADEQDGTFAVAFSPDGMKLASVSERGFVRLWDLQTGKVVSKVLGHVERTYGVRVYGVAFAPDGLTLATAGSDQSVRLWDAATGAELLELQSEEGGGDARPVVFSPDGSLLASGTKKGTIQIWNLTEGGEATTIPKAHERDIVSLAFTNDGKYLISSGIRLERTGERSVRAISEIHMWDVVSGEKEPGFETEEELEGNCTLAISRDGRVLASGHYEKIVLWDVETRKLKRIIRGEKEHYGGRTHGLAISPDGSLLASGAFGAGTNKVYLWNLQTGEPVFPQSDTHTEAILAMSLSPDGSTIATGSADGTVRLWNAKTDEHLRLLDKGSGWVRYFEFFPDGQLLALGRETHERDKPGFEGEVKIFRVADGKVIHHLPVPDRVMCGALSLDGEMLAVGIGLGMDAFGIEPGASECKILVWSTKTGRKLSEFSGHTSQIQQVVFAPNSHEFWSTSDDQTVQLWKLNDDQPVERWTLTQDGNKRRHVWGIIDPDTLRVALRELESISRGISRGKLMVRKIKSDEALWEKTFDDSWPREFALSADGKVLAAYLHPLSASNDDDRISVLSTDDGKEIISFNLDDGTFLLVAVLLSATTSAGELLDPIPILVGDKPLDVEQMGHAAPFVADFDRDGVKDLLVGEFYMGRLRIYRNLGSNQEPRFAGFSLFKEGDRSGRIHSSCCMGFGPQLVDFDSDGRQDMISGNWIYEVILFRGLADGSFAAGEPIKDRNGRPINIGYGVTAFAVDWDADGDLDLLAGTVEHSDEGNVYLVRNERTAEQHAFGNPEKLLADGQPVVATDGGAAPVAADWDRDGKAHLILGCGNGSVRWYRNQGSSHSPQLSSFQELVAPPANGGGLGLRAKPCVTDWNEDGRLDLLIGDVGERFEKQPTAEEEVWRKEAKSQQTVFLKEWARVFAHYRELMMAMGAVAEAGRDEHQRKLAAARNEMARLNAVRVRFHEQEASLKPGVQTHGRVWLLLNSDTKSEPVASK